jgi:hypothetical protein
VRLDQEPAAKSRRYVNDYSWTTTKDYPTGRLCLQAYSPDYRGEWTQQWRETKGRDLASRIASITNRLIGLVNDSCARGMQGGSTYVCTSFGCIESTAARNRT